MSYNYNIDDIKVPKELGEYLKNAREQAQLSIEQIQKDTRIRARYLTALENGDFSVIPGGDVYVKGFLKHYANSVGLDSDTIIEIYKKIRGEPVEGEIQIIPLKQETTKLDDSPIKANYKTMGVTVLMVILLVFFIISIRALKINNSQQETKPPINQDMNIDEIRKEPIEEPIPVEEDTEVMVEVIEDSRQKTVYLIDDDFIELTINITGDRCWISVIKDGNPEFEGTLNSGEIKTWRAERNIDIRIGNPVVTNVIINGKNIGNLTGQARNFIFERRT